MLAFTFASLPEEAREVLAGERYVSVTSFRRDGLGVATPVEFVMQADAIFFRTLPDCGKVKRMRREPRVLIAACTMRGKVKGHKIAGTAALLSPKETQALMPAFEAKYGRLWGFICRLRPTRSQGVRVDLS